MVNKWITNVPVATLWTSAQSPRAIDEQGIKQNPDLNAWIASLDYEKALELCNANLVQSQLLYGEEVVVIEETNEWFHVVVPTQPSSKNSVGYPGWVPKCQMTACESWDVMQGPIAVVTAKKANLTKTKEVLTLSYLTVLPLISEKGELVSVQTPDGEGVLQRSDVEIFSSRSDWSVKDGEKVVEAAEQFLDLPYFWGGMSSFGYDCSGLSYAACKANGVIIPRDAHDQSVEGEEVSLDSLQRGDLLFFAYEEGKGALHHVGIYYGDGKLLHSPKTGKNVEIIPLAGTVYEKELMAARRFWKKGEDSHAS